ncbi:MAG: hypothetical protein MZV65_36960 [Chromatiales bacterium]|nr:hypothetical protein [Chromatiales bacterium]
MEDERVALGGGHFGDQIGAAVFDALLLGGEQFGVDQIQLEQVDRHVQQEALEDVLGDDVFLAHGRHFQPILGRWREPLCLACRFRNPERTGGRL